MPWQGQGSHSWRGTRQQSHVKEKKPYWESQLCLKRFFLLKNPKQHKSSACRFAGSWCAVTDDACVNYALTITMWSTHLLFEASCFPLSSCWTTSYSGQWPSLRGEQGEKQKHWNWCGGSTVMVQIKKKKASKTNLATLSFPDMSYVFIIYISFQIYLCL